MIEWSFSNDFLRAGRFTVTFCAITTRESRARRAFEGHITIVRTTLKAVTWALACFNNTGRKTEVANDKKNDRFRGSLFSSHGKRFSNSCVSNNNNESPIRLAENGTGARCATGVRLPRWFLDTHDSHSASSRISIGKTCRTRSQEIL